MLATDYLIIGSGAVGMAFADILLTNTVGTEIQIFANGFTIIGWMVLVNLWHRSPQTIWRSNRY